MTEGSGNESMLEMYIFETSQLLEKLEQIILDSEKCACFSPEDINEIFRIMHTIKGSSAMMLFNNISAAAHSIEDLFFFIREEKSITIDCQELSDLLFDGVDFIKVELEKVKNGDEADGDASLLMKKYSEFLKNLKKANPSTKNEVLKEQSVEKKQQYYISPIKKASSEDISTYKIVLFFESDCGMESIRAFTAVNSLKECALDIAYFPEDIINNDKSDEIIQKNGFKIYLKTEASYDELNGLLHSIPLLKDLEVLCLDGGEEYNGLFKETQPLIEESPIKMPKVQNNSVKDAEHETENRPVHHQSLISVNVEKLDKLMDLVGELVISQAMVIQNPDLKGLTLDNFYKASSHLQKITDELQDMIMSVRMVPLATTFQKMHRIVRDMCKKLDKEVKLSIVGEETEVDKNLIEHISDPLMHLIRNSLDHGMETPKERIEKGKAEIGTITLEARNAGSDVLIIVKDDGRGLNKDKILERARNNGLIKKLETELTDNEIYSFIFMPGFSTRDNVTEFSGRGVGMDVVVKNIQSVGGSVSVESTQGTGTSMILKIPLTLAIIDGMNIGVGNSRYTIPTTSIKQSFRPKKTDIITDPDGREMIMVRGQCYSLVRLHKTFKVETEITDVDKGIIVMVESEKGTLCLFADELIGEQQVVVKALPNYIKNMKRIKGLSGCTLLGDGSISLILDVEGLFSL